MGLGIKRNGRFAAHVIFASFLVAISHGQTWSATITLNPTDDATITSRTPDLNSGSVATLVTQKTYSEDFNDGVANGFTISLGTWSVENGVYVQSSTSGNYICYSFSPASCKDCTVRVSAKTLSSAEANNSFIIFDRTSVGAKVAGFDFATNSWFIGDITTNPLTLTKMVTAPANLQQNTFYTFDVKIDSITATAAIEIGGSSILSYTYSDISSSKIGVATFNFKQGYIDDFEVVSGDQPLGVSGMDRSLIRFSQSEIATALQGTTLTSATLRLYLEKSILGTSPGLSIGIYRMTANWNEGNATWNCAVDTSPLNNQRDCSQQWPGGLAAGLTTSVLHVDGQTGWVEFDVTSDVNAFLSGTQNFGWLARRLNENHNVDMVQYTSKEGASQNRPQLVLVIPDTTPPTITAAVAPLPNAAGWNNTDPTVTFICSDSDSGIQSCPSPVTVSADGANQVVSGTATDNAGNSASTSVTINLDKTPPSITASASPLPNTAGWNNSDVTVSFNCSDGVSGIDVCPSAVTVVTEGASQTITRAVNDVAGNAASASATINLDKTPPLLQIGSPSNGSTVNANPVTITGTATDNFGATLTCNGAATSISGGSFECSADLSEGQNTIALAAADLAGNQSSVNLALTLTTPPVVTIDSPANGSSFNAGTIPVSGTATDNVSVQSLTINGDAAQVVDGKYQASVSLNDGDNTITVVAEDDVGNESTASITVNRYSVPEITISSPVDLTWATATTINVSGTVSVANGTVEVNGLPASVSTGSFTVANVPLTEGGNVLTATVTDSNGRVGSASVRVIRDVTPPEVTIDYPADGIVLRSADITVTGLVNDITMGTVSDQHAQVTVNGIVAQVSNRSFLAPAVPLLVGDNVITAVATDRQGNSSSTTIHIIRENPAGEPQIRMVSGNNQVAAIGTEVAQPLIVELLDEQGNPAINKDVIFKVVENNGVLCDVTPCAPSATYSIALKSDPQGRALVHWKLGTRAGSGNDVVSASAPGFPGNIVFTATGALGTAANIYMDSGSNQYGVAGEQLPRPFVAVVTDAGHNRLAGVPVTFSVKQGNGNFEGQTELTVSTDMDGRAVAFLTLDVQGGIENNVAEATFPGNAGSVATFTASGKIAGDPAATRISGVVLDNSDVPIEGVTIRIKDTAIATQTDAQGQFSIQPAPVGHVDLIADGTTANRPGSWPTLEYQMVTVSGQNNTVNMPIRLLPIDLAHGMYIDETHGGTLTVPDLPGFSLQIAAGSATFPDGQKKGTVSVTLVHADKIPMVPNFGQQPRFIVTIQPAGVRFDPPAPVTFPNLEGLAPGQITELYSFDHDLGSFVAIGTGHVSLDGSLIQSDNGVGIIKGGWHCGGDPTNPATMVPMTVSLSTDDPKKKVGEEATVTARGTPSKYIAYVGWEIFDDPADPNDNDTSVAVITSASSCATKSSCDAKVKGVKPGKVSVRVGLFCLTTGFANILPATLAWPVAKIQFDAELKDVIVDSTDHETFKVASIDGHSQTIHFVTARYQQEIILKAKTDPDTPEVHEKLKWTSGTIALQTNNESATVSSDFPYGIKIPMTLALEGTSAPQTRNIVVWVVSADFKQGTPLSPPGECEPRPACAPSVAPSAFCINAKKQILSDEVTLLRAPIAFTFEVLPISTAQCPNCGIIPAPGDPDQDKPNLKGDRYNDPPPVPKESCVDYNRTTPPYQANSKWDVSRQYRSYKVDPHNLRSAEADYLQYPSGDVVGNDDSGVLGGHEDTDPYTAGIGAVGEITDHDAPNYWLHSAEGSIGDEFNLYRQFREFARLNIGGQWFRISDFKDWRFHIFFKKINEASISCDLNGNGTTSDDLWWDEGSLFDATNNNWPAPPCSTP